jgi:hypothetical protein
VPTYFEPKKIKMKMKMKMKMRKGIPILKYLRSGNMKEILCNFLVWTLQSFEFFFVHENMKKTPSKVAHNWPNSFLSVLSIGPKPTHIAFSVSLLLYMEITVLNTDMKKIRLTYA